MIELTQSEVVTVESGQTVPFNSTVIKSGCAEYHRDGSSAVRLIKPGRYLIGFSSNIAIPDGGTVGEISLGINADGGILSGSIMRAAPAAVEEYFNVSIQHYIDVPACCGNTCYVDVSVINTGAASILVDNANITAVHVSGK